MRQHEVGQRRCARRTGKETAVIARTWRGWTRRVDADAYTDYVLETGIAAYRATPGNRGAYILRRDDGERTEFVTFSLWESLDDIRGFAGDEIGRAVFYPEDDRYLVDRELTVDHYEVAASATPA
jgi:heme-degrading monooxygenase HmoA